MSTPTLPQRRLPRVARVAGLGLLLVTLGCVSASACPSCMDARNGRMRWFAYTTGILTFLPVAAIGAGAWWLRRAVRAADALGADALGADDSLLP